MSDVTVVWFRHDLRLDDNPALASASARGPVVCVFVWSPGEEGKWPPGGAARVFLHGSIVALDAALRERGLSLVVRSGGSLDELRAVVRESGASAVYWNRRYEPAIAERDEQIAAALTADGCEVRTFNGSLLFEPWDVSTGQGGPYKVFTPFWRACMALPEPARPSAAPRSLTGVSKRITSLRVEQLQLQPRVRWDTGIREHWQPGKGGGAARLERFLDEAMTGYDDGRDRPDLRGTSELSPHLHFGEISPRRVWHAVRERSSSKRVPGLPRGASAFLREIGWREFGHHLLHHFPHTPDEPLRAEFSKMPWRRDAAGLRAWQKGLTGFPIVDAGMRQLWSVGWMHNRVRMIVASFLVKDLLLPWQEGEAWFWDTLVDADLANNTLGWQWVAGCGADAAPFFRVFNPTTQGQRHDPGGAYVRRWVPELAALPDEFIHDPSSAPPLVLASAKVDLGVTYPRPIVDHAEARERALAAFERLRGKR